jgi:kynureninase
MNFQYDLAFVQSLDGSDKLSVYRERFLFPQHNGSNVLYFTGNSLGLQPKGVKEAFVAECDDWATYGVEGHFLARKPWYSYHERFAAGAAKLVGAKEHEVVMMNQLTVNLNLLLVSFYKPEGKRRKILFEAKPFPSDQYAFASQARLHGLEPEDVLVELLPREGEWTLRTEDIVKAIHEMGDELALVCFGGVNYFTGQLFDMKEITAVAHEDGAMCGFDLAHAIGNVELKLHDWGVDFACWCSYKYLNGGPGAVGAIFVHDQHLKNPNLKRLTGWWGYPKEERFKMHPQFVPAADATSWQLGTPSMILYACLKASLQIFEEAGWKAILEKQSKIKGFLDLSIQSLQSPMFTCLTPASRGCQVSLLFHAKGRQVYDRLFEKGFMVDWREPNVIRLAPVPLYNSFNDIWNFHQSMEEILYSI